MNSMERVLAAIEGAEVDRKAVTITLSLYGAKLTDCPLEDYYSNPKAYLNGQLEVIGKCSPDIVFSPFILSAEAEAFGCDLKFIKKNPPNLKKSVIHRIEDVLSLQIPDIESNRRLQYIREATRLLAGQCGNEKPVAAIALSPMELPSLLMGMEYWLETFLFDWENALLMFEKAEIFFVNWVNSLFSDGANFVVLPSIFTNPRILSEKIVRESVIPLLTRTFKKVNGPLVFHHGGNPFGDFIEHFTKLPNVAAFVLDSRDKFSDIREKIGSERILMGNINGPNLWRLKPEDIYRICKNLLLDRKDDKHFIMATSGADVAYDTPLENIIAFTSAVKSVL